MLLDNCAKIASRTKSPAVSARTDIWCTSSVFTFRAPTTACTPPSGAAHHASMPMCCRCRPCQALPPRPSRLCQALPPRSSLPLVRRSLSLSKRRRLPGLNSTIFRSSASGDCTLALPALPSSCCLRCCPLSCGWAFEPARGSSVGPGQAGIHGSPAAASDAFARPVCSPPWPNRRSQHRLRLFSYSPAPGHAVVDNPFADRVLVGAVSRGCGFDRLRHFQAIGLVVRKPCKHPPENAARFRFQRLAEGLIALGFRDRLAKTRPGSMRSHIPVELSLTSGL